MSTTIIPDEEMRTLAISSLQYANGFYKTLSNSINSGKATIRFYLAEANLPYTDKDCVLLVEKVKECAEALKRAITKEELLDLYTAGLTEKRKLEFNLNK